MKIMFKCRYVKGNRSASHLSNLVNYIATREGVEKKSNYVDYIANRPRVEKLDTHGLFNSGNKPINLSEVQRIVSNHQGNVWLPIISLTREDATATGYDNLDNWQILMSKLAPKIAENFKIKLDNFHWYAAFHNESHHPHIHMVLYSDNPNEGYLTEKGIGNIKSTLMKEIFSEDLQMVYKEQTQRRNALKQECKRVFKEIVSTKDIQNPQIHQLVFQFFQCLKVHKGKKQYGYLSKSDKQLVDSLLDEISKIPTVKTAYDLWWEMKNEVYHGYSDREWEQPPISQSPEFKSVKNMLIREIADMNFSEMQNEIQNVAITNGVLRFLNHLSKTFDGTLPQPKPLQNFKIDSKRLRKLAEKKLAQGQKFENNHDFEMTM